jgi:hypothetical protein
MAKNVVDLNKLKKEIDVRKQEKNMNPSKLGESTGTGVAPRDAFLNGLITSLKTGSATPSTKLIQLVENKVAIKNKETVRHNVNESEVVTATQPRNIPNNIPVNKPTNVDMSPERDELLWAEVERKKKQTLAESLEQYVNPSKTQTVGAPVPAMNLNEGYLVENVKKIVDNYLIENFGPVVEEAIKSTILELYAVERIKEVLQENKEMVKAVVIETIREIQAAANAKKKAQQ